MRFGASVINGERLGGATLPSKRTAIKIGNRLPCWPGGERSKGLRSARYASGRFAKRPGPWSDAMSCSEN